jgi:outer membrane protein insertion porin family
LYQNLNNAVHPTRGNTASANLDVAGLGGSKHFLRLTTQAAQFWPLGSGFVFSVRAESGFIKGYGHNGSSGSEVLLTDRFFLGQPQMRGFDYRGIGPRVIRRFWVDDDNDPNTAAVLSGLQSNKSSDDALGGTGYYLGKFELEIPLGSGAHELGLRPSVFMDVGSVFGLKPPVLNQSPYPTGTFLQSRNSSGQLLYTQIDAATNSSGSCVVTSTSTVTNPVNPNPPACITDPHNSPVGTTLPPFQEEYYGNYVMPRLSVGAGVNWNSPFGPLRIDVAYALLKKKGDQTKLISFNVGTQF